MDTTPCYDEERKAPEFPSDAWFMSTLNRAARDLVYGLDTHKHLADEIASEASIALYKWFEKNSRLYRGPKGKGPKEGISEEVLADAQKTCHNYLWGATHKLGIKYINRAVGKGSFEEEKVDSAKLASGESTRQRRRLPRFKIPDYAQIELLSVKMNRWAVPEPYVAPSGEEVKPDVDISGTIAEALDTTGTTARPLSATPTEAAELAMAVIGSLNTANRRVKRLVAEMFRTGCFDINVAARACNIPTSTAHDVMNRFRAMLAPQLSADFGFRLRRAARRK